MCIRRVVKIVKDDVPVEPHILDRALSLALVGEVTLLGVTSDDVGTDVHVFRVDGTNDAVFVGSRNDVVHQAVKQNIVVPGGSRTRKLDSVIGDLNQAIQRDVKVAAKIRAVSAEANAVLTGPIDFAIFHPT